MLASERERLLKQWLNDHKGLMFKVVRAFAGAPEDQDDLFQEIFLQLWLSIPSFRGEAKASTWIYRVALNTALGWDRAEKKHRRRYTVLVKEREPRAAEEDGAEAREMVDWLYGEIRKLPKIDGSLVLLYLDGLSYRAMAEILGISESNVGVKLNRIKKRLAEAMKGAGDGV